MAADCKSAPERFGGSNPSLPTNKNKLNPCLEQILKARVQFMHICPICNKKHDGTFGSGKYCNRKCSNTRKHSEETKKKISEKVKGNPLCGWRKGKKISEDEKRKISETKRKKRLEMNFDDIKDWSSKRIRIIEEQEGKCFECGISEWNGKSISLEIEHLDANRNNNKRSNLIALCPNCHSQTKTWRRNKIKKRFTDEEIYKKYLESNRDFSLTLKSLNYAQGSNWNRLKDIVIRFERNAGVA